MHNKLTHPRGGTNPPPPKPPNDAVFSSLLQPYNPPHDNRIATAISPPPFTLTSVVYSAISWLRNRRIRFLFFLLCSPFLLVFLLVTSPLLCITEICLRRRLWRKILNRFTGEDSGDRLRRCEEGCCYDEEIEEKGLLHRYLEDQLFLVRSMYECGEDEEFEEEDSRRVEDNGNFCSNQIPLLR
ncbi:hypothetical protein RYX36_017054 [Vicia faba]